MKKLLLVVLALFPGAVYAECTMKLTETIWHDGVQVYTATQTYTNSLTKDETQDISAKGRTILDVASKVSERKTGKYAVEFSEEVGCDGKPAQITSAARVEGVTAAGLNQIHRQALKVGGELIKMAEDRVKGCKAKAWGKD